jgi:hypothetical protein
LAQTKPSEFDLKKTVLTTQEEKPLLKRMYVFTIVKNIYVPKHLVKERKWLVTLG